MSIQDHPAYNASQLRALELNLGKKINAHRNIRVTSEQAIAITVILESAMEEEFRVFHETESLATYQELIDLFDPTKEIGA